MSFLKFDWQNILALLVILGVVWSGAAKIQKDIALMNNSMRAIQGTLMQDTQNLEALEKRTAKIEDVLVDRIHANTRNISILEERTKWLKQR